ncbi:MAG TPA: hypothetical protein VNH18_05700 [Bryobacteraceae bacterium]|nr:hypothetical protein [Bryobacteraceae bacterium]
MKNAMEEFAPGWVTTGWAEVNGIRYELGHAPGVTSGPVIPPHVPERS